MSPSPESFSNPNTSPIITATNDGGFILNPKSMFPLTIYGVTHERAERIKELLELHYSGTRDYDHLACIIVQTNLWCKEIRSYIEKFKPQYLAKIEELKASSSEWSSASEKDKKDLLAIFRKQAIETLDIKPYCDIETLLEHESTDSTTYSDLFTKYGCDNLKIYLRHAKNLNKIHIIPASHYERPYFEKLVEAGLAVRGNEIPIHRILETLSLKEINELVGDLNQQPFKRRKSQAIEFLINLPDIKQRVGKIVAFRELFQLKPLSSKFPTSEIEKLSKTWNYAIEIARIMTHTYIQGGYSLLHYIQSTKALHFIKGWKILSVNDANTCPYCKRSASKTYPLENYPKTPLHIGCRCSITPIFTFEEEQ